jgi:hypothetical protein
MEANVEKSYNWFQGIVRAAKDAVSLRLTGRSKFAGAMFFMKYDPIHKKTLPYYDIYPLIIVLDYGPGYIMGLNVHYLDHANRARFFKLLRYEERLKKATKTHKVTPGILAVLTQSKYSTVMIKKYKLEKIRAILPIPEEEWDIATFLPLHEFRKATPEKVWEDSRNAISKPKKTP